MSRRDLLLEMYRAMLEELGPSNWWPGDTAFEVAVGAILTQNTNWQNVEKAIANMKSARVLDFKSLSGIENTRLEELIRPAGYYRIKAARLLNFLDFLGREAEGSMTRLAGLGLERVRPKLLAVKGV
ncbi:MAG: endonuclease III domain-containing protein, partial [Desulfovibrionaceae bacterium]|nr:endonuclease III domain-containing protein [Desulfovibrionaceae bacterium]